MVRWANLSPEDQARAAAVPLIEQRINRSVPDRPDVESELLVCRCVRCSGGGEPDGCILDPGFVSRHPDGWQAFRAQERDPHHARVTTRNVLANAVAAACGLRRDQWAGRPGLIVANGPSAARLPDVDVPRGAVTIAINGALELAPGADVFFMADALVDRPGCDNTAWGRALVERCRVALRSVSAAVFSLYASPDVVGAVPPERRHFHRSYCDNYHRQLVDPDRWEGLPFLIEGLQGLAGALHLAWWLGLAPLGILGADQSIPPENRGMGDAGVHAGMVHAGQNGSWLARDEGWEDADGVDGPVLTKPVQRRARDEVDAVCLFLRDGGCYVFNLSSGLPYAFAPRGARWA